MIYALAMDTLYAVGNLIWLNLKSMFLRKKELHFHLFRNVFNSSSFASISGVVIFVSLYWNRSFIKTWSDKPITAQQYMNFCLGFFSSSSNITFVTNALLAWEVNFDSLFYCVFPSLECLVYTQKQICSEMQSCSP